MAGLLLIFFGFTHEITTTTANNNNVEKNQRRWREMKLVICVNVRREEKQTNRRREKNTTHTHTAGERNKESIKSVLSKMQEHALIKRHRTRGAISMSETTMNKWNS